MTSAGFKSGKVSVKACLLLVLLVKHADVVGVEVVMVSGKLAPPFILPIKELISIAWQLQPAGIERLTRMNLLILALVLVICKLLVGEFKAQDVKRVKTGGVSGVTTFKVWTIISGTRLQTAISPRLQR